jgi:iron(III) transport system substrate-binding protein
MIYLRDLSKQNIVGMKVSARQVLDRVIAGEYPLSLAIFNHHAVISAQKGAPSAWIPMNPGFAVLSVVGVTKDARSPNAAKLLVEFLVSKEGQELYRDTGYIPVDPQVPASDAGLRPDGKTFRAISMTPEAIDDQMPKWAKIASDLFR